MTQPTQTLTRSVEQFLFREARLLDERALEEWLTLFTPDGVYFMPLSGTTDPTRQPSVLFDTAADRAQRVYQLLHTPHYAQIPASRTVHQVTNIEIAENSDETVTAHAVVVVWEVRPGDPGQVGLGQVRTIEGRARYDLVRADTDTSGGWLISKKTVTLLTHDLPVRNLSFIF